MTPEQRSARASKAGQKAAANRRAADHARQAKRIAEQEAADAKARRERRVSDQQRAFTILDKKAAPEKAMAPAPEPPLDVNLGRVVEPPGALVAEAEVTEGPPEDTLCAMAAHMLDPPGVFAPEANRIRMMILRRALAEGRRRGWPPRS